MIQQETMLDIADNSGVKSALCIKVLGKCGSRGKFTRPVASVGDIVCVAIKNSLPSCSTVIVSSRHIIAQSRLTRGNWF